MLTRTISATSQKRAAQQFNFCSVISIILMPVFPLLLIWIAASIVVYSSNIYHPSPRVRAYTKWAGYRFYGLTGLMLASMLFSGLLMRLAGGAKPLLLGLWIVGFLIVAPMGLYALIKADKDNWQDITVEDDS